MPTYIFQLTNAGTTREVIVSAANFQTAQDAVFDAHPGCTILSFSRASAEQFIQSEIDAETETDPTDEH